MQRAEFNTLQEHIELSLSRRIMSRSVLICYKYKMLLREMVQIFFKIEN